MTGYLVNFAVYTMAMLGLIFFALMVYKKFTIGGISNTSKTRLLSIEETISIAPRKTLYVVRAGNEKFLIAGDVDKTTLISKLGTETDATNDYNEVVRNRESEIVRKKMAKQIEQKVEQKNNIQQESPAYVQEKSTFKTSVDELPVIVDFPKKGTQQPNVLHDMLRKINK